MTSALLVSIVFFSAKKIAPGLVVKNNKKVEGKKEILLDQITHLSDVCILAQNQGISSKHS